jgi:hypothetical protein
MGENGDSDVADRYRIAMESFFAALIHRLGLHRPFITIGSRCQICCEQPSLATGSSNVLYKTPAGSYYFTPAYSIT